jgi:Lantibiotic biosynthesis dehydratase C-term
LTHSHAFISLPPCFGGNHEPLTIFSCALFLLIRLGDELLQSLGLDAASRVHLYFQRFQWFASIYQFDTTDYDQLEKLYSKKRQTLNETFDKNTLTEPSKYQFLQNSEQFVRIGAAFSLLEKEGQLTVSRLKIFAALHHMHYNRAGYNAFKELSTIYCMYRWLKDQVVDKGYE